MGNSLSRTVPAMLIVVGLQFDVILNLHIVYTRVLLLLRTVNLTGTKLAHQAHAAAARGIP